jgi:hypothetical protein
MSDIMINDDIIYLTEYIKKKHVAASLAQSLSRFGG